MSSSFIRRNASRSTSAIGVHLTRASSACPKLRDHLLETATLPSHALHWRLLSAPGPRKSLIQGGPVQRTTVNAQNSC